jgi:hypothetical protein
MIRLTGALDGELCRTDIARMTERPSRPYDGLERRQNPRLRELVDEMLASIRVAANMDLWTAEERARYEADMARIMESVREHALDRGRVKRAELT